MSLLASTLATAGIKLGGGILGNLFGGRQALPDIPVYANVLKYGSDLRGVLGEQQREALGVSQRESLRAGGVLSGAYLENVADIQKQINDIYGRNVSSFALQQSMMQSQWAMEQAKVSYGEGVQSRANWQSTIGDVFGTIAAYPSKQYQANRQTELRELFESKIPSTPETTQNNPMMDLFNNYLMLKTVGSEVNSKLWDVGMGKILDAIQTQMWNKQFGYNPQPIITPLR